MNDLRGCGSSTTKFRLSHLRIFYKFEKSRQSSLRTRTTPTALLGHRNFSNSLKKMVGTQTKWTAPVVRKQFLDFFQKKGHTIGTWWGSGGGAKQHLEGILGSHRVQMEFAKSAIDLFYGEIGDR